MNKQIRQDAILFSLFLVLGAIQGSSYVRAVRQGHLGPAAPEFNLRVFGAAVMSVCGRGLTTPNVSMTGAAGAPPGRQLLIDFLMQRRETIACADIPGDLPVDGLDGMQRASRYLILLATSTWTLTGPSWAGIDSLLGVMFGLSVALAYLICRLAMGRIVATTIAAMLLLSPVHLASLPDLRDYAKAPFFAASLLIAGLLAMRRRRAVIVVGLSATGGALLGFGFGVRTDIVVNLVLVLAVIVGFLPNPIADSWKTRLVAAAVCVASFATVAAPIFGSNASGSNIWHWALLGYAEPWNRTLEIGSALYEPGYFYSDSYVATTVDAFWGRATQAPDKVSVGVAQYADASRAYYGLIVRTFPADPLLRGWAAVIQILNLPYSGLDPMPPGALPGWLSRVFALTGGVRLRLAGFGVALFAVSVLAVSVWSVRLALLMLGLVVLLGAYPAIQFQLRHVFHLELLSLWILGFLVSGLYSLVVGKTGGPVSTEAHAGVSRRAMIARPLALAFGVVLLVILPLTTLRAFQQHSATALFDTYEAAPLEPLSLSAEPAGPVLVRVPTPALARVRAMRSMHSDMLVAEMSASKCPVDRTTLTFRYAGVNPEFDFTRTYDVEVPSGGRPAKVYFPVYEPGVTRPDAELLAFEAVEVAASELGCMQRLSRFADPDSFPLLLPVVLPPEWRTIPLHQTLRGWERDPMREGARPISYWAPVSLSDRGAFLGRSAAGAPGLASAIDYSARIVRVGIDSRVAVNGVGEGPGSYLVAWKARPLTESQVVVAEGQLERGGLTVGVTDASGWVARVDIDTPGAFRAFLHAPHAGTYQVVIANHLIGTSLRNRFTISRIVVVDGKP